MPETNELTTRSMREAERLIGMIRDELNQEDSDFSLELRMKLARLITFGMDASEEGIFLGITIGSWERTDVNYFSHNKHFEKEVCAQYTED